MRTGIVFIINIRVDFITCNIRTYILTHNGMPSVKYSFITTLSFRDQRNGSQWSKSNTAKVYIYIYI
jgi:hypothetical protein